MQGRNLHADIEIKKPSGAVIADTQKIVKTGDLFSAIKTFISGCVVGIGDISDKQQIKNLVGQMPYRSAETVALKIMAEYYPDDDGIEGVYRCPRCGDKIIAELKEQDGMKIDTRDFISMLPIGYMETPEYTIDIELSEPVILRNTLNGEIILTVNSFAMQYPTIENCINAYNKQGLDDDVRLQYVMYAEAIKSINGQPVDQRWINSYGLPLFEGMKDVRSDIGTITEKIRQYGIQTTVPKKCRSCGKEWRASVNTANFFASALELV